MAYEFRRPRYNFSGTLLAGISAADTSITPADGIATSLPTDYSSSLYLPLVLANDAQGKSEVVYVTGHGSGSAALTIVRGREGTSAQSFSAGDIVRCSVTARDLVQTMTQAAADALTDAHVGMQITDPNTGKLLSKTLLQGFEPLGYTVNGTALGQAVTTNVAAPTKAVPQLQVFNLNGQTVNGGFLGGLLPAGAYPTALMACIGTVFTKGSDAGVAYCKFNSCTAQAYTLPENANGPAINFGIYNAAGALVGNNVQADVQVIAVGY